MLLQVADDIEILRRYGVADGIRNIDRGGTSLNHRLNNLGQKRQPGPGGVLGRELDVRRITDCPLDRSDSGFKHLLFTHLQLMLHMDVAGRDEGMNPATLTGVLQCLPSAVNVHVVSSRKSGDLWALNRLGNLLDRFKIAIRGDRKTGFHDIDIKPLQLVGDPYLFLDVHARAWRLLTITQSGIKNNDLFFLTHNYYLACSEARRSIPGQFLFELISNNSVLRCRSLRSDSTQNHPPSSFFQKYEEQNRKSPRPVTGARAFSFAVPPWFGLA